MHILLLYELAILHRDLSNLQHNLPNLYQHCQDPPNLRYHWPKLYQHYRGLPNHRPNLRHDDIATLPPILPFFLYLPLQWRIGYLWTQIWSLDVPPKIRTFLWSICQNALPTRENLLESLLVWSCGTSGRREMAGFFARRNPNQQIGRLRKAKI